MSAAVEDFTTKVMALAPGQDTLDGLLALAAADVPPEQMRRLASDWAAGRLDDRERMAARPATYAAQLEAELHHMRQDRDRLKDVLHHRSQALNRVANQNDELRTALNRAQEDASERK